MKKFNRTIKRFLALCLCAALLCGAACAEGIREICFGLDYMHYGCTLADGRMVLVGAKNLADGYDFEPVARVVCLNPDRTASITSRPARTTSRSMTGGMLTG